MGQKINPISLRLGHFRSRDSSWYSDLFYKKCLSFDLSITNYYNQFLKHYKIPETRIGIQYGINQLRIFPFLHKKKTYFTPYSKVYPNMTKSYKESYKDPTKLGKDKKPIDEISSTKTKSLVTHSTLINYLVDKKQQNIQNLLETTLSNNSQLQVKIAPFLVKNYWQSANFLADEIVYFLERRVRFVRIKNRLLKQIETFPWIKGVRIICSGRLNGKSKRANQEYVKYGETPLHSFNRKIDFSSKTAHTAFGSLGVKVWICYK